ncbi:MAG TPA: DUF4126 domain-containing protein [Candidatus Eremiobacteraceae bacterium]|nr:DUF4126 domain-containing protein [Candidatus Eremiobacteraceae bacterium]
MDATGQYALAYALTTTAGLRGFLTLFAASVAAHYHFIHPSGGFAWLASDAATVVLGVFALLEMIADKVPAVDHALHAVSFAARPLAGAILVGGTVHTDSAGTLYTLMALGALNSLIVHSSSASARAASTMTTFATANAPISVGEDVTAIFGIVLAFLHPYIAAILAALFVMTLIVVVVVIAAIRSATRSTRGSPESR